VIKRIQGDSRIIISLKKIVMQPTIHVPHSFLVCVIDYSHIMLDVLTMFYKIKIEGYSRETSMKISLYICNSKYKKPLELHILFNSR
jgi:hypothetical protein